MTTPDVPPPGAPLPRQQTYLPDAGSPPASAPPPVGAPPPPAPGLAFPPSTGGTVVSRFGTPAPVAVAPGGPLGLGGYGGYGPPPGGRYGDAVTPPHGTRVAAPPSITVWAGRLARARGVLLIVLAMLMVWAAMLSANPVPGSRPIANADAVLVNGFVLGVLGSVWTMAGHATIHGSRAAARWTVVLAVADLGYGVLVLFLGIASPGGMLIGLAATLTILFMLTLDDASVQWWKGR